MRSVPSPLLPGVAWVIALLASSTGCVQELDYAGFNIDCSTEGCPAPLACSADKRCVPADEIEPAPGGEGESEPPTGEGEGEPPVGEGEGEGDPPVGEGEGEGEPPVGEGEGEPPVGEGEGEGEGELPVGEGEGEGEGEPPIGEGEGEGDPAVGEGEGEGEGEDECGALRRLVEGICVQIPPLMRASDDVEGAGHASSQDLERGRSLIDISDDGRFVGFVSSHRDYDLSHLDAVDDVFVRDLRSASIVRASEPPGGGDPDGHSRKVSISSDGSSVAFLSDATNLVDDDGNDQPDAFVRDLASGAIELATRDIDGVQSQRRIEQVTMSGDATVVAFASSDPLFGSDGAGDIILRTLGDPGLVRVASLSTSGAHASQRQGANAASPSLTADGGQVVFHSYGAGLDEELAEQLPPTGAYIYLRRTLGPETLLVSRDAAGGAMPGAGPVISADGSTVAYLSADHLDDGNAANNSEDVFVRDLVGDGGVELVSARPDGLEAEGEVAGIDVSADGRYVVFLCGSDDLVDGDANGLWDAFLYDRQTQELRRVSQGLDGQDGAFETLDVAISGDGSAVAFLTQSDLLPDDRNAAPVVYVRHYW